MGAIEWLSGPSLAQFLMVFLNIDFFLFIFSLMSSALSEELKKSLSLFYRYVSLVRTITTYRPLVFSVISPPIG